MPPSSVVFLEDTITEPRPAPSKVHIAHAVPTNFSKATFGWLFLWQWFDQTELAQQCIGIVAWHDPVLTHGDDVLSLRGLWRLTPELRSNRAAIGAPGRANSI